MHEMTENRFRAPSWFRASDGVLMHEMHETSLEVVLSCRPSCTGLRRNPRSRKRGIHVRTNLLPVGGLALASESVHDGPHVLKTHARQTQHIETAGFIPWFSLLCHQHVISARNFGHT
jgi:hypothetical protein